MICYTNQNFLATQAQCIRWSNWVRAKDEKCVRLSIMPPKYTMGTIVSIQLTPELYTIKATQFEKLQIIISLQ